MKKWNCSVTHIRKCCSKVNYQKISILMTPIFTSYLRAYGKRGRECEGQKVVCLVGTQGRAFCSEWMALLWEEGRLRRGSERQLRLTCLSPRHWWVVTGGQSWAWTVCQRCCCHHGHCESSGPFSTCTTLHSVARLSVLFLLFSILYALLYRVNILLKCCE